MGLLQNIHQLLKDTGPGRMTNTAYDTAWIARLNELDYDLSNQALDWICENQLPDGSWGSRSPLYYHDRVVCTLAAVIALTKRGRRGHDRAQQVRGVKALEALAQGATGGLASDPGGATVGFEMIVPTLLAEAEALGVIRNHNHGTFGDMTQQREKKIAMLKGQMISRHVTMAHSVEMAGPDAMRLLNVADLQEANGSVANSPSATAYFAMQVQPGEPNALAYLRSVMIDGGAPNAEPFDVFERSWVLWNLSLVDSWDAETLALCLPHLDHLVAAWQPGQGVGFSIDYAPKDGDDTSISYEVLSRFGRPVDVEAVLSYEQGTHFKCFNYESFPSISVNIHIVGALRQAGFENHHPSVQKALSFLKKYQVNNSYWYDKWHASPYYSTAHAIIAGAGYANELLQSAVDWVLRTQNSDGSWGYYMPTAEETAYCLQALALWQRSGQTVPPDVIHGGRVWLDEHQAQYAPPLWIDKCLYSPSVVVRSVILSALQLTL